MLNARLFALPISNDTVNAESAEQQRPPIDLDPMVLNNQRYQQTMNEHYGTSTTGSR